MKTIFYGIAVLFLLPSAQAAKDSARTAVDHFREKQKETAQTLIEELKDDYRHPAKITILIISPVPISDAAVRASGSPYSDDNTFCWNEVRRDYHEVFGRTILTGKAAAEFGQIIYEELSARSEVLGAFCFQPAHGIEIDFSDGTVQRLAICLHCGNLEVGLPFPGTVYGSAIKTKELIDYLEKNVPISVELEKRFFSPHG